jgi:hypothetical protein
MWKNFSTKEQRIDRPTTTARARTTIGPGV